MFDADHPNKETPGATNAEGHAPTTDAGSIIPGSGACASSTVPIRSAFQTRVDAIDELAQNIDPRWKAEAEQALLAHIDAHGSATVDDVRDACSPPNRAGWWCAIPRGLAARGVVTIVAKEVGRHPITHRGLLRRWVRAAEA